MKDCDLLRDYLETQSSTAFAELVNRHVNLVYGTALRVTSQPPMAEDVTQSVFIRLARKAQTLRDGHALPAWLYRTTCHAAYSALRADKRRRERELISLQFSEADDTTAIWKKVGPLLEEAMGRLDHAEQDILVRRYFEGRNLREIGESLGLSDDAAQKRVHRAVEKLRAYFAREGVLVPSAALIPAISSHVQMQAPSHLAGQIASTVTALPAGGSAAEFIKHFLLMSQSKLKMSAAAVLLILLFSILGWLTWGGGAQIPGKKSPPIAALPSNPPAKMTEASRPVAPPEKNGLAIGLSASTPAQQKAGTARSWESTDNDAPEDKQMMTEHAVVGLDLATDFISYANGHHNQLPSEIPASTPGNSDKNHEYESYPYEIVYSGSLDLLTNSSKVIMLREKPFQLSDGKWVRTYVFVDQHVNTVISDDGDFSSWEKDNTASAVFHAHQ